MTAQLPPCAYDCCPLCGHPSEALGLLSMIVTRRCALEDAIRTITIELGQPPSLQRMRIRMVTGASKNIVTLANEIDELCEQLRQIMEAGVPAQTGRVVETEEETTT